MLRFEKSPRSRSIGLSLRKKTPRLTQEILLALVAVILLHLAFYSLFSIKPSLSESYEELSFPIEIVALKSITPSDFEVTLQDALTTKTLQAPPFSSLPSLKDSYPPLKEELDLGLKSKKGLSFATICGQYPLQLSPPPFSKVKREEQALVTFRSDEQGKVFWFDWLKKTSEADLDNEIESWIKTLTLDPRSAFFPQLLDLGLVP